MKRDKAFVIQLLKIVEAGGPDEFRNLPDQAKLLGHLKIMKDAGLIADEPIMRGGQVQAGTTVRLTWAGHDHVEAL